jgi:polyisoprenyl-phosphate glycosyltransferase
VANPVLSIVIPVLNEEKILPELWERLSLVLSTLNDPAEVIFVDDGSSDQGFSFLLDLSKKDPRVKLIRLSRNFGHQPALSAGIDHASGDAVVLMDGDLQDRPEAIPDFVKEWRAGSEVVYAVRASRKEGAVMRLAFKLFYRFIAKMSGIDLPPDAGIFGLLDRKVINVLKSMPERNRYFPGLRAYAGFGQKGIPVERDARHTGSSRVRLGGLIKLAADGIFAFSYIPIRMATGLGLLVAAGAFLFLLVIAFKKFVSHVAILGWASTLGAVLFIGGLQLVMLGIVGEYVGRIYEETKNRPYYIVSEKRNLG